MEKIQIFNNFFNETELNNIKIIIDNIKFNFGHISLRSSIIPIYFFSQTNFDKKYHDFIYIYIKNKIELLLKKKFIIDRFYIHIQTFSQDGEYHTDNDLENMYTFIIYLNENELIENMNGEFLIKIPNTNYINCIQTNYNSAIFFPSNYIHKGMAYNRFFSDTRICVTYKLKLC